MVNSNQVKLAMLPQHSWGFLTAQFCEACLTIMTLLDISCFSVHSLMSVSLIVYFQISPVWNKHFFVQPCKEMALRYRAEQVTGDFILLDQIRNYKNKIISGSNTCIFILCFAATRWISLRFYFFKITSHKGRNITTLLPLYIYTR